MPVIPDEILRHNQGIRAKYKIDFRPEVWNQYRQKQGAKQTPRQNTAPATPSRSKPWEPVIWGLAMIYGEISSNVGAMNARWQFDPGSLHWSSVRLDFAHHETMKLGSLADENLRLFDYDDCLWFESCPANQPMFWRRIHELAAGSLGTSLEWIPEDYEKCGDYFRMYRGELKAITLTATPAFGQSMGRLGIDIDAVMKQYPDIPGMTGERAYWLKWLHQGRR